MIGKKFGRLTVVEEYTQRGTSGRIIYKCRCDCGNEADVSGAHLRTGHTRSCGCSRRDHIKHGQAYTRLYHIYHKMKARCYYKHDARYSRYGGRGITLCDEWLNDFMNFYNWAMNNGYSDELSIDRINNNNNYGPSNCRWATNEEQQNNKSNCVYITYDERTQTMSQWSRELNIPYITIKKRHARGYSDTECLFGRNKNGKNQINRTTRKKEKLAY